MRTSGLGSFCRYTLPFSQSGQRSPDFSSACWTVTLRAPLKGSSSVAAVPGLCLLHVRIGNLFNRLRQSGSTELVFSVLRTGVINSTSVCSVSLILW